MKSVYFSSPSTPTATTTTTVSFLLASRSLVSIMELTRSPINLDVYTLATLHYGGAGRRPIPHLPVGQNKKGSESECGTATKFLFTRSVPQFLSQRGERGRLLPPSLRPTRGLLSGTHLPRQLPRGRCVCRLKGRQTDVDVDDKGREEEEEDRIREMAERSDTRHFGRPYTSRETTNFT